MAALKSYNVRIVQAIIGEYAVTALDGDAAVKAGIVAFTSQRGVRVPDPIVEVFDA